MLGYAYIGRLSAGLGLGPSWVWRRGRNCQEQIMPLRVTLLNAGIWGLHPNASPQPRSLA